MNEHWQTVNFDELSGGALYEVLRLRSSIFVVEQECAYLDMDNLDQQALHMLYWKDQTLCAYQRCLVPGASYEGSSIGRIVVAPECRGENLGRELVQRGITFNFQRWPNHDICIHAQAYLQKFYASLGFVGEGDEHLEDGILHRHMRYAKPRVEK